MSWPKVAVILPIFILVAETDPCIHTCKTLLSASRFSSPSIYTLFSKHTLSDEETVAIVQKALKYGSLKQWNSVNGIMGSGKTCLLFRIKLPGEYTSTGVIGNSFQGLMHCIEKVASFEHLANPSVPDSSSCYRNARSQCSSPGKKVLWNAGLWAQSATLREDACFL